MPSFVLLNQNTTSILMKNLNVTLKCHVGQVTWWDGAGQGGAKQSVVYKPPRVCPTGSVLLVCVKITTTSLHVNCSYIRSLNSDYFRSTNSVA